MGAWKRLRDGSGAIALGELHMLWCRAEKESRRRGGWRPRRAKQRRCCGEGRAYLKAWAEVAMMADVNAVAMAITEERGWYI